jgi:hypothetical protein
MTIKMFAPAGVGGVVHASRSGSRYTIGADGSLAVDPNDVADLERAGWTVAPREGNSASGVGTIQLNLLKMRNTDGSAIAAAAAAGKFGCSISVGTSSALISEVANNNAKTDVIYDEIVLPSSYIAGQDLTLTVNAGVTIGSGTLSVRTLTASAYKIANAGTHGANLIATAAQTVANTVGDLVFTITGATLNPGDRLGIQLSLALTETATQNVSAKINSARLS